MSVPNVSVSLVNPQSYKDGPFDYPAILTSFLSTVPVGLRHRVVYWLPGTPNLSYKPLPVGAKMPFYQGLDRTEWDLARATVDAHEGSLIAYLGVWGAGEYTNAAQRAAALYPYRQIGGTCLWFDNADGYEDGSPEVAMVRAWLEKGYLYSVGIESNYKRAWIDALAPLAKKYPGRIEIIAESFLWEASEPDGFNDVKMRDRYTMEEATAMGFKVVVLIARRVSGNNPKLGWPVTEQAWPTLKADLCKIYVDEGYRVCLRPSGMPLSLLSKVELLNL